MADAEGYWGRYSKNEEASSGKAIFFLAICAGRVK